MGSLNLLEGHGQTAPRPKPQLDAWKSKEEWRGDVFFLTVDIRIYEDMQKWI